MRCGCTRTTRSNTRWVDFWYDASGVKIAEGNLHDINVDEYTLTPPSLAAISAPTALDGSGLLAPLLDTLLETPTFPVQEEPSGTKDGVNKTFTISQAPLSWLGLWRGGLKQEEGASKDYTLSGTTITFTAAAPAPASDETLVAVYWIS